MIQRIQTLYLLAVVALGLAFIWLPVVQLVTPEEAETLQVWELSALGGAPLQGLWGLLLTTALIPLLAFIDIFLYKKRPFFSERAEKVNGLQRIDQVEKLAIEVFLGGQGFFNGHGEGAAVFHADYLIADAVVQKLHSHGTGLEGEHAVPGGGLGAALGIAHHRIAHFHHAALAL